MKQETKSESESNLSSTQTGIGNVKHLQILCIKDVELVFCTYAAEIRAYD